MINVVGLRETKFFVAGIPTVGFIVASGALRHALVAVATKFFLPMKVKPSIRILESSKYGQSSMNKRTIFPLEIVIVKS